MHEEVARLQSQLDEANAARLRADKISSRMGDQVLSLKAELQTRLMDTSGRDQQIELYEQVVA